MAFGFLKSLFHAKNDLGDLQPDLRGPLNLGPGDSVRYYQEQYSVTGVIVLVEGLETRYQYFLATPDAERRILTAEDDRELVLTLQKIVGDELPDYDGGDSLDWDGRPLQLTNRGRAAAWCLGDLPPERIDEVAYREFEDDDEEALLVLEHWGQHVEVRTGEIAHEGEFTFERQGRPDFEIKAPPRIDLRALSEARNAERESAARRSVESDQAELAAVREKLRNLALEEAAEPEEGEEEEAKAGAEEEPAKNFLDL